MQHKITVNRFELDFWSDGYPRWVEIRYEGKPLVRVHHKEIKDLEYALGRIRDEVRKSLPTNDKEEA